MPAFSLLSGPTGLTTCLRPPENAPLPIYDSVVDPAASVMDLSPVYFRRWIPRPVSYYALFKGWLLLSQPPGCLSDPTSFHT